MEIITHNKPRYTQDGSLNLTQGDLTQGDLGDFGSGSGEMLVPSSMSTPLPPLPADIDNITFTWTADTQVSVGWHIRHIPVSQCCAWPGCLITTLLTLFVCCGREDFEKPL